MAGATEITSKSLHAITTTNPRCQFFWFKLKNILTTKSVRAMSCANAFLVKEFNV